MKFTKKPVTIEAVQWTGDNLAQIIAFTDGRPPDTKHDFAAMKWDEYCDLVARDGLKIFTLEGKMSANVGDWIIKGVKGEHYPCKPDIFEMTYGPAAPTTAPDTGDLAAVITALEIPNPYTTDTNRLSFQQGVWDTRNAILNHLKGT